MPAVPLPEQDPLLRVSEVAARLRVSKMTVYRLIDKGVLPATRVGNEFRVAAPALQEYLAHAAHHDPAPDEADRSYAS
jgi:excisionase family DNA binding protein